MTQEYISVLGTDSNDTVLGTSAPNFINGRDGNDIINGLEGDDILLGASGADHFTYSALPQSGLPQGNAYDQGVDAIIDFSRSEGDRIDFSDLSPSTPNGLTFSGTTPAPYSVYYSVGVESPYDIVTGTDLEWFTEGDGVTLMADLDGNSEEGPEIMATVWGWFG